ncbi:MAG: Uma2 family endonuclease [Bacteroidetes bacterium]|nr:Uma2 family endonuclease [Bacteroidota bacterium]
MAFKPNRKFLKFDFMGYPAENRRYSLAEYIEAEDVAEGKNEYYDGEVYAMSGGTPAHSGISANCTSALKSSFRSLGCRVFESNLRIQVESLNNVLYPDASVICGPLDCNPKSPTLVRNPTLVLEGQGTPDKGSVTPRTFASDVRFGRAKPSQGLCALQKRRRGLGC